MNRKSFKILMLHGHGQSAEAFRPKCRLLEDIFLRQGIKTRFVYLSAPHPAYRDGEDSYDARVWGYGDICASPIEGLEQSIGYILSLLDPNDPFDGIVGFSSGAALTAIITSMLETKRPFCGTNYKIEHPQLKFAVCLSGFQLQHGLYKSLYSQNIETPIFHTIGSLDPTIPSARTRQLARLCPNGEVYEFYGGHYVPQSKEAAELQGKLSAFLWKAVELYDNVPRDEELHCTLGNKTSLSIC